MAAQPLLLRAREMRFERREVRVDAARELLRDRELTDRGFPILKVVSTEVGPDVVYGLNIKIDIAYRDFVKENAPTEIDEVSAFVSLSDALKFAEYDITDQALVDSSVVIANSNRVKVVLTEQ